MKKVMTVIGARPQFIKAAAISRVIRNEYSNVLEEIIIHTGQHYDANMSQVFFDELNIPKPYKNLEIIEESNDHQINRMTTALNSIIEEINPDIVLVYGDTNSTHAAALSAASKSIPLVHVEAGLRSFNLAMPEETNRIVADKNSTLLFVPTEQGIKNLKSEGFDLMSEPPFSQEKPGVFLSGDVMYDNSVYFRALANAQSKILELHGLKENNYLLATVHRDFNTDDGGRLSEIFKALSKIGSDYKLPIVLPLHPRTEKMMEKLLTVSQRSEINDHPYLKVIPPTSYLDMIELQSNAKLVLTDSGGVQKEAFFFQKPCVILRPETEWVELVQNGNALIGDADAERIYKCFQALMEEKNFTWPPYYGDGRAAYFICETIKSYFS